MKLHRIAILVCLGFGGLFQLVRAEEPSVMLTFNGLRFGCFPVVNVPYTAEEAASRFRTGNWREGNPPVFVARDSQGRTLRRQRIKDMCEGRYSPKLHDCDHQRSLSPHVHQVG